MTDFCISDLHLGHNNCIALFKREDGSPLRDFPDVDTMNETIINNINSVAKERDRLFILGDVVINKRYLPLVSEIKCTTRILIGGNHDVHYDELQKYFKRIHGCFEYNHSILTHIPVHPSQVEERFKYNIHGHLHANLVTKPSYDTLVGTKGVTYTKVPDPRYKNVSVERINYTPVNLQEITQ